MNRVQFPVRPVTDEKCVLVLGGKLGSVSEGYPSRRPRAHIHHRTKGVTAIIHEFPGTRTPPVISSVNHMIDSGRAVPRRIHVPFHIRVIGEELSLAVQSRIVLVAEARGHYFPGLPLGVDLSDVPERSFSTLHVILQGGMQLVFGPQFGHPGMAVILGQLRLVTHDHI